MKNKLIKLISCMAIVFGGLVAFSSIRSNGIQKASASDNEIDTMYQEKAFLEIFSNLWGKDKAYYTLHYWGGGATENTVAFGEGSGNSVLSTTWDRRSTHCEIKRCNPDNHSEVWNQWNYYNSKEFTSGRYNYFKNTAWEDCYCYCALLPGDCVYLDCNIHLGNTWYWDNSEAVFKAYLWGSKSITLQGRNQVHGVKDNNRIYEFKIPSNEDGYWINVKFDRCNPENPSEVWNQSIDFTYIGANTIQINNSYTDHKNQANFWFLEDNWRNSYFSNYVMSTFTCDGEKYTFKDSLWGDFKQEYNHMCDFSRKCFDTVEATSGSDNSLSNAAGRFDELVNKRGFENFTNRAVTNANLSSLKPINFEKDKTFLVAVPIIIGVLSLSLFVLFMRKKYSNR